MPTFYPEGNTVLPQDNELRTLHKIADTVVAGSGSGGGGGGVGQEVFFGSGDPNGVQTAIRPAIFYSDDGAVWNKMNAGNNNTGWVEIIEGA